MLRLLEFGGDYYITHSYSRGLDVCAPIYMYHTYDIWWRTIEDTLLCAGLRTCMLEKRL